MYLEQRCAASMYIFAPGVTNNRLGAKNTSRPMLLCVLRETLPRHTNVAWPRYSGAVQAFGQLRQMLSRLEDEAEREQEALRLRIDEETAELKATMTFSRASVVASVEQEVGLRPILMANKS